MASQILRIFEHLSNQKEASRQDYELAKAEVHLALLRGDHRRYGDIARFYAAMLRQDIARARFIRML